MSTADLLETATLGASRALLLPLPRPAPRSERRIVPEEPQLDWGASGFSNGPPPRLAGDGWGTAGAPLVEEGPRTTKARVERLPSASGLITDKVREALQWLLLLLESEATRYRVPQERIELAGYTDPEEDIQQLVVAQWVKAPAEAALDYWDRLGLTLEAWVDSAPRELGRIVAERIAITVQWD